MAGDGDKTHAATPHRLQKAREDGNLPLSREAAIFAGLVGGALILNQTAPAGAENLLARLSYGLGHLGGTTGSQPAEVLPAIRLAGLAGVAMAAPFLTVSLLAGVMPVLLQTGFLFNAAALRPDIGRLNPAAGLKRLFGVDSLIEAAKSLLKIGAIVAAIWMVLSGDLRMLSMLPLHGVSNLVSRLGHEIMRVLLAIIAVQAAIAGFDLFWVQLRHVRRLRMSREELRHEARDSEGDPRVKARLRQLRAQRARKRMMAAVPTATVVVTNPTHYAVALSYDRDRNAAPRVVAKGMDSVAARIREAAHAHGVPLVASPLLARALYTVELDTDIPAEHFQAVAEIIAYVWKLSAKVGTRRLAAS